MHHTTAVQRAGVTGASHSHGHIRPQRKGHVPRAHHCRNNVHRSCLVPSCEHVAAHGIHACNDITVAGRGGPVDVFTIQSIAVASTARTRSQPPHHIHTLQPTDASATAKQPGVVSIRPHVKSGQVDSASQAYRVSQSARCARVGNSPDCSFRF